MSLNELISKKNNNNLNELINIPNKAEDRFVIYISFRTQGPNIKTLAIRNPRQKLQLIDDPLCFPLSSLIWSTMLCIPQVSL